MPAENAVIAPRGPCPHTPVPRLPGWLFASATSRGASQMRGRGRGVLVEGQESSITCTRSSSESTGALNATIMAATTDWGETVHILMIRSNCLCIHAS